MSAPRSPPPVVNVFKACGANVTTSGEVTETFDNTLGRKVLTVHGDVPAAHHVKLPKAGKPGLGLGGNFVYFQLKLAPGKFFSASVDVVCVDRSQRGLSRSNASTAYQVGRKIVTLKASNLYTSSKKKDAIAGDIATVAHLAPEHAGWYCVRLDVNASLRRVAGVDTEATDETDSSSPSPLVFESVRGFQIGGRVSIRNVFVTNKPYDEESCPDEMLLTKKPGVEVFWVDAGVVEEYGRGRSARETDHDKPAERDAQSETFARGVSKNFTEECANVTAATGGVSRIYLHEQVPDTMNDAVESTSTRKQSSKRSPAVTSAKNTCMKKENTPSALTLHNVFGASCVSSNSMAVSDGVVAYASDKAVIVCGVGGGTDSMGKQSPSILLGHTDFVTSVSFSRDSSTLVTGQHGSKPLVLVWRRETSDTSKQSQANSHETISFVLVSRVALDFDTLTFLDVASDGASVAVLGNKSYGQTDTTQKAGSIVELWDLSQVANGSAYAYVKRVTRWVSNKVLTEVKFCPFQETSGIETKTLFACGDGTIDELLVNENGFIVEKTVVLDSLDLEALVPDAESTGDAYHFTALAFHEEESTEIDESSTREKIKTNRFLFAGTKHGAVLKCEIFADEGTDQGNLTSCCVPQCAFQLHETSINSLHFGTVGVEGTVDEDTGERSVIKKHFATSASDGGSVRVWPSDFCTAHVVEATHDVNVRVVQACFSDTGKQSSLQVITATSDGSIGSLDVFKQTYSVVTKSVSHSTINAAASDPGNNTIVALACDDGVVRAFDVTTGTIVYECAIDDNTASIDERATSVGFSGMDKQSRTSILAVGYSTGLVRVFEIATGGSGSGNSTVLATSTLLATITDAHEFGYQVDCVLFAGDEDKLFSAARDGYLCVSETGSDLFSWNAKSRVRVSSPNVRAAASVSECKTFVFVAACTGSLNVSAVTGGGEQSSHVLAFRGDTLALVNGTWRSYRGGICGMTVAGNPCQTGKSHETPELVLAGDDTAAVVSHHTLMDLFADENGNKTENQKTPLSVLENAREPVSIRRGCHDSMRKQSERKSGRNASQQAITGIAYDSANDCVVTCGADGTVFTRHTSDAADPSLFGIDDAHQNSSGQRFISPHRSVTGLVLAGDRLVTFGDGDAVCVWAVEERINAAVTEESRRREPVETLFPETSAFGLEKDVPSVTEYGDLPGGYVRNAPTSAGYAAVPPEPWSEQSAEVALAKTNADNTQVYPTRSLGLSVGTAAARRESSRNAAAVAASCESPNAFFIQSLGAVAYAAGSDVIIERLGGDKTQASLRGAHNSQITALGRHPLTNTLASAAACSFTSIEGSALICLWDGNTGKLLDTVTRTDCGGVVTELAFSPSGEFLLAVGQDPDGAVQVWKRNSMTKQSGVKYESVFRSAMEAPLASGVWLSDTTFVVVGVDGATGFVLEKDSDSFSNESFSFHEFPQPSPVCTAISVTTDGTLFVGDSKGGVWVCNDVTSARTEQKNTLSLRLLQTGETAPDVVQPELFPTGEAVTALCAFGDAHDKNAPLGVFVGGAKRARALQRDCLPIHGEEGNPQEIIDISNDWFELGELDLDGAVVSASGSDNETTRMGIHSQPNTTFITVTTSAGSVWCVRMDTGVARALSHAHPTPVNFIGITKVGLRNALLTCTDDGAGRVWDCVSGSKTIETYGKLDGNGFGDNTCVVSAASPCGSCIVFGREDGSISVVETKYDDRRKSSNDSKTSCSVAASDPYTFTPHPDGGAVICCAFVESIFGSHDVGYSNTQTLYGKSVHNLLTVSSDGSVCVTEFGSVADENTGEIKTETKTNTLVVGGPGGVRPVLAASVEVGVTPTRVALARRDGIIVVSVAEGVNGKYAAAVSFEYAPESFVTNYSLKESAEGTCSINVTGGDMNRAVVAWSSTNAGVLFYASAVTNFSLVVLDTKNTNDDETVVVCLDSIRGEGIHGEGVQEGIQDRNQSGNNRGHYNLSCLSVAGSDSGTGDLLAIGTGNGVVFCEIKARDTAGFAFAKNVDSTPNAFGHRTIVPKKTKTWHSATGKPVRAVAWQIDESLTQDIHDITKTTAWVAAGEDVHAFENVF